MTLKDATILMISDYQDMPKARAVIGFSRYGMVNNYDKFPSVLDKKVTAKDKLKAKRAEENKRVMENLKQTKKGGA